MILSDLGFDADGYALANGHYYIIDLFSDAAPNDLNNITIPEGTYTIGGYAETTAGTFTSDYSRYQDTSETSGYSAYFTDGTVTVSYSGSNLVVDAVFVDELGSTHHVTYNGPCDVLDDTSLGGATKTSRSLPTTAMRTTTERSSALEASRTTMSFSPTSDSMPKGMPRSADTTTSSISFPTWHPVT